MKSEEGKSEEKTQTLSEKEKVISEERKKKEAEETELDKIRRSLQQIMVKKNDQSKSHLIKLLAKLKNTEKQRPVCFDALAEKGNQKQSSLYQKTKTNKLSLVDVTQNTSASSKSAKTLQSITAGCSSVEETPQIPSIPYTSQLSPVEYEKYKGQEVGSQQFKSFKEVKLYELFPFLVIDQSDYDCDLPMLHVSQMIMPDEIDLETDDDQIGKVEVDGKLIKRIKTLGGTPACLQVVNNATWTPFLPDASFGLLRNTTRGKCVNIKCEKDSVYEQHKSEQSENIEGFRRNRPRHYYHHTIICCNNCVADYGKNVIGDYCCCPQQRSANSQSVQDQKMNITNESLEECDSPANDCNTNADTSEEITNNNPSFLKHDLASSSESDLTCPPPPTCPTPEPCPSPPPCPTLPPPSVEHKLLDLANQTDTEASKKNPAILMIPEDVPIIPSPQLDMLTKGLNFEPHNIQNLHLSTIKPPLKTLVQNPPVDNFPPHDCCTRCSDVSCSSMNQNTILASGTFSDQKVEDSKCQNKELKKIMIANMKRDPSSSKRAIQRAAEKKFSALFHVICSRNDFTYITHALDFCEVSRRGNACYAFKSR
ncbi:unnamed protein product [Thelazia callipaeda]|uniref:Ground-like domain-containing protein n=1 Tax=Thelazia callipaeda TaxID=103827 RepID=A0A0N5D9B8_THECL|nr:unnamed protein product [Thelazia callipaeda]